MEIAMKIPPSFFVNEDIQVLEEAERFEVRLYDDIMHSYRDIYDDFRAHKPMLLRVINVRLQLDKQTGARFLASIDGSNTKSGRRTRVVKVNL
jgi:hypothetical protein